MHIYCVHWILNALCVPILPLDFSLFSSNSTRFISSKYLNRAFSWPKPMQDSKMHSERLWVHCVGATSIQKELFFRCVIFSTRHTAPRINSTITLNRVHWPTKNTQIEREKKNWKNTVNRIKLTKTLDFRFGFGCSLYIFVSTQNEAIWSDINSDITWHDVQAQNDAKNVWSVIRIMRRSNGIVLLPNIFRAYRTLTVLQSFSGPKIHTSFNTCAQNWRIRIWKMLHADFNFNFYSASILHKYISQ